MVMIKQLLLPLIMIDGIDDNCDSQIVVLKAKEFKLWECLVSVFSFPSDHGNPEILTV